MSLFRNIWVLFFIGLSQCSFGQKTAKYSNEYMNLGAGARAFGMANSVVATTNDVTSGYWNPAGLTNVQANIDLSFMHSEYFADIANYDYLAFQKESNDEGKIRTTLQPSIGDGLQLNQIKIDYAFTDLGNTSSALYSHIFSINFSIYKED